MAPLRLRGHVILFPEAWGTNAQEHEIDVAGISDSLRETFGDANHVERCDRFRRIAVDLDSSLPFENDVTFYRSFEMMQLCGDAGRDAGAGDGALGVVRGVVNFNDVTAFRGIELRIRFESAD